jgi:hypothetical protein
MFGRMGFDEENWRELCNSQSAIVPWWEPTVSPPVRVSLSGYWSPSVDGMAPAQ